MDSDVSGIFSAMASMKNRESEQHSHPEGDFLSRVRWRQNTNRVHGHHHAGHHDVVHVVQGSSFVSPGDGHVGERAPCSKSSTPRCARFWRPAVPTHRSAHNWTGLLQTDWNCEPLLPVHDVHLEAVINPGPHLHDAGLIIKREVGDVHRTRAAKFGGWRPKRHCRWVPAWPESSCSLECSRQRFREILGNFVLETFRRSGSNINDESFLKKIIKR
ncbi:hypothetical protein CEXT_456671 [Caerostris extrusa]|uniref:Uncharacterized protein n=1 Tax=Caerostris extrusa TaxID=172846 RepID=A0AAV4YCQ0_CAEEX|nr:hypothetical protein CEXT_456671 [Caerostris extrusa]